MTGTSAPSQKAGGIPASRMWQDLYWGDLAREQARGWIAVLPLAAIEQHGPPLPLGTDAMIAESFVRRVLVLLGEDVPAIFLPAQNVTLSTEHLAFPGTLTLPASTAIASWTAIGESVARAGIRKRVMVTSHGGNSAAMDIIAQDLRARLGMLVVTTSWLRFGAPAGLFDPEEIKHGIHGGDVETSLMLAAAPNHVRMDKAEDFRPASRDMVDGFTWLNAHRPAGFAWQAQDLHPSGAIGNAANASAEKGDALLHHGAQAFCDLLKDVQNFDMARLNHAPKSI